MCFDNVFFLNFGVNNSTNTIDICLYFLHNVSKMLGKCNILDENIIFVYTRGGYGPAKVKRN